MNEFQFIDTLKNIKKNNPINLSIGDDTAIINFKQNENKLICSDTLVEDIHFSFNYFTLYDVIKKAIIVNLSDILAMNGKPLYYLLNLSIPKNRIKYLNEVANAIRDINAEYKIDLIGGDTTSSKDKTFVSVTMIGETNNPILRDGATLHDEIFIGGMPGKSSIALEFLLQNKDTYYKKYHIEPKINFKFLELFKKSLPNSLIDISDGVINDLSHILEETNNKNKSNLGAIIYNNSFKDFDPEFFNYTDNNNLDPYNFIYNGGEDFIPLFTTNRANDVISIANELNLPLINIGKITDKNGILDLNNKKLQKKGYLHF